MKGLTVSIGADSTGLKKGLGSAAGLVKGAAASIGKVSGVIGKIAAPVAAIGGLAGLAAGMTKAISKAAEMETLETAFIPLLGSADAAQARIAELAQFAASTPFELPQIAAASKTLETLTRGALSTGDGLTMVGDVASATGQPFDMIATTIGRLYDGLDSGRPVGEALARLQELGVVSGDVRGRIEDMQKEGMKGPEVWAIAEQAMGRFGGSMKLQSGTWSGLISTLKDNISNMMATFGTPIIDALKPFLKQTGDLVGTMTEKAAEFGQKVADGIQFVIAMFKTGNMTSLIGTSLKLGFMYAVNALYKALVASLRVAGQMMLELPKLLFTYFKVLVSPDFWKGMGNALIGIAISFIAFLKRGTAELMEVLRPLAELFGKGETLDFAQDDLRRDARNLDKQASDRFKQSGADLEGPAKMVGQQFADSFAKLNDRFQDSIKDTRDIMDTTQARDSMGRILQEIKDAMPKKDDSKKDVPANANPQETAPVQKAKDPFKPIVTSFARVGGGGYGTGLMDAQRENNKLTAQTNRILQKISAKQTTPALNPPNPVAVFG